MRSRTASTVTLCAFAWLARIDAGMYFIGPASTFSRSSTALSRPADGAGLAAAAGGAAAAGVVPAGSGRPNVARMAARRALSGAVDMVGSLVVVTAVVLVRLTGDMAQYWAWPQPPNFPHTLVLAGTVDASSWLVATAAIRLATAALSSHISSTRSQGTLSATTDMACGAPLVTRLMCWNVSTGGGLLP